MNTLLTISVVSILFFGCSEQPMEKEELPNKIEELQKSNDVLQKKNDSLSNALNEVKDEFDELIFSQDQGIDSPGFEYMPYKYRSQANNEYINVEEDAKSESDKNFKKNMDKLKTPRNTIPFEEQQSNPFSGSNSGSEYGGNGYGSAVSGSSMGYGEGKGYGDPKRENNPKPPDYNTDFSGNVCVELLINAQGKAISAKSCNSTSHPDQNVIKSVVEFVKKNVKYKAEPGAPNRKAFYTVYISAD